MLWKLPPIIVNPTKYRSIWTMSENGSPRATNLFNGRPQLDTLLPVRVEGLLVSVRIHQRKDSRGDRDEEEGIRK